MAVFLLLYTSPLLQLSAAIKVSKKENTESRESLPVQRASDALLNLKETK